MDSVTNKPFFATVEVLQVLLFSVEVEAPDVDSATAIVKEAMAKDAKESDGLHYLHVGERVNPVLIDYIEMLDEEVNIKSVSELSAEDSGLPQALMEGCGKAETCILTGERF